MIADTSFLSKKASITENNNNSGFGSKTSKTQNEIDTAETSKRKSNSFLLPPKADSKNDGAADKAKAGSGAGGLFGA